MTKPLAGFFRRCIFASVAIAFAMCASGATQYVYDDLGRVVLATESDGSSTQYSYDAVGNLTAITRTGAGVLTVGAFSPASGPEGTVVLISGSGFSPIAAENAVKFNGTAALVTSSTATSLTVTVPTGATTGTIQVTTAAGTASSSSSFSVTSFGITSISPHIGVPGTQVTINGNGFSPSASGNQVLFQNSSAVTPLVASANQLRVVVPASASSGHISVAAFGKNASSADVFVVPTPGYSQTDVAMTGTLVEAAAGLVFTISAANRIGIATFDGLLGRYMTLQLTNVTMAGGTMKVFTPNGSLLASTSIANNGYLELPALPATGTYSVYLIPGTNVGSATVSLVGDTSVTINSTTFQPVSLSTGQRARMSFDALAGENFSFAMTGIAPQGPQMTVTILKPDGTTLITCTGFFHSASGNFGTCDFRTPADGTYVIVADPDNIAAMSFNATLTRDLLGQLDIDGSRLTFTARAGQNARYAMSGTAGQRMSLVFTNNTLYWGKTYIYKPDGSLLTSTGNYTTVVNWTMDLTLPTTGTYTVVIYVDHSNTGTIDLAAVSEAQGTLPANASINPLALAAGQNGRYTFDAIGGQSYSLALGTFSSTPSGGSVSVTVLKPDGTQLVSCGSYSQGSGTCDFTTPSTGTYALFIDDGTFQISFNICISPDLSGVLVINDPATTFATTAPGQNIRYTFAGTASQHVTFRYTNNTIGNGAVYFYRADGSFWTSLTLSGASGSLGLTLPSTGTYKAVVFVNVTFTGHVDVQVQSP